MKSSEARSPTQATDDGAAQPLAALGRRASMSSPEAIASAMAASLGGEESVSGSVEFAPTVSVAGHETAGRSLERSSHFGDGSTATLVTEKSVSSKFRPMTTGSKRRGLYAHAGALLDPSAARSPQPDARSHGTRSSVKALEALALPRLLPTASQRAALWKRRRHLACKAAPTSGSRCLHRDAGVRSEPTRPRPWTGAAGGGARRRRGADADGRGRGARRDMEKQRLHETLRDATPNPRDATPSAWPQTPGSAPSEGGGMLLAAAADDRGPVTTSSAAPPPAPATASSANADDSDDDPGTPRTPTSVRKSSDGRTHVFESLNESSPRVQNAIVERVFASEAEATDGEVVARTKARHAKLREQAETFMAEFERKQREDAESERRGEGQKKSKKALRQEEGDLEFYSEESLVKRALMREHPRIRSWLQWWCASLKYDDLDHNGLLDIDEYTSFHERLSAWLATEYLGAAKRQGSSSREDVRAQVVADFNADSNDDGMISRDEFHGAVFELADNWTESIEVNEYIQFLKRGYEGVYGAFERADRMNFPRTRAGKPDRGSQRNSSFPKGGRRSTKPGPKKETGARRSLGVVVRSLCLTLEIANHDSFENDWLWLFSRLIGCYTRSGRVKAVPVGGATFACNSLSQLLPLLNETKQRLPHGVKTPLQGMVKSGKNQAYVGYVGYQAVKHWLRTSVFATLSLRSRRHEHLRNAALATLSRASTPLAVIVERQRLDAEESKKDDAPPRRSARKAAAAAKLGDVAKYGKKTLLRAREAAGRRTAAPRPRARRRRPRRRRGNPGGAAAATTTRRQRRATEKLKAARRRASAIAPTVREDKRAQATSYGDVTISRLTTSTDVVMLVVNLWCATNHDTFNELNESLKNEQSSDGESSDGDDESDDKSDDDDDGSVALALDIVVVNEDSDVFADASRVPCQVGGDCQDLGWCDDTADGAWCRGESRTWWVIGHVSRGCEWVSEDPDARCWTRGRHAELDCANGATVADEWCNYTVVLDDEYAFEACCETCDFGTCEDAAPETDDRGKAAQKWIEISWMAVFLAATSAFFVRAILRPVLCKPRTPTPAPVKLDDAAVDRSGLAEIGASSGSRSGRRLRYAWPGGRGTDGGVRATLWGFVRFMWRLNGRRTCFKLIACQMFIASYPAISGYYVGLIFDAAAGSSDLYKFRGRRDGTDTQRLASLVFTGYGFLYAFDLWVKWVFWENNTLGRFRYEFRNALLLKLLRLPAAERPTPGDCAGILMPRVDEAISFWGNTFLVLCGAPFALFVQIALIASTSRRIESVWIVVGPLLIVASLALSLWRHAPTLVATAEARMRAEELQYRAAAAECAKRARRRPTRASRRRDAETFAVANFVLRRRNALKFFVALEAQFESGLASRALMCATLFLLGSNVIEGSMSAGDFVMVYNVLNEMDRTARKVAASFVEDTPGSRLRSLIENHAYDFDLRARAEKIVDEWKAAGVSHPPANDAAAASSDLIRKPLWCVLDLLLGDLGADPNAATKAGLTPLHLAAKYDNERGVDALLRHGAKPLAEDGAYRRTALHFAAAYAGERTVLRLLDARGGEEAACRSSAQGTPLQIASLRPLKAETRGVLRRLREALGETVETEIYSDAADEAEEHGTGAPAAAEAEEDDDDDDVHACGAESDGDGVELRPPGRR
ncbi:hypothetical protein JL722_7516 [Aureococcus anophagefferens]|nr:hypothetical protein JL722_7516 [Aureococcus anophagefferens]